MRPYRSRVMLPPIPSGYALDDVIGLIVPVARTNLITNPSFETNTTGWTAVGGSIARSTTQQYHGSYSLAVTPGAGLTDGVYFGTVTLALSQLYAVSAKVYGQPGVTYKISVATTGGSDLAARRLTGTGRWQWVWVYWHETTGAARRIYITKVNSADTHVMYVDGAQCEAISAGETVSTYLDGDQVGLVANQFPPAYGWNGTPHASTSYRTLLTRAGGMVMRWREFGFVLTAIVGLGLAIPQNVALDYAQLDGGQDLYTRKPSRQFSLVGRFEGSGAPQLRARRSAIARQLDRDASALDQQLVLLHQLEDGCGSVLTDTARLHCKYAGGLGGNTASATGEAVSAQFVQYAPMVVSDREQGASLTVQQSVANANYILLKSTSSGWQALGTGANGVVAAVRFSTDDTLYIAGAFTLFNGVASTKYVARYNLITGTVTPMGTGGTGGTVAANIRRAPNGDIWVAGDFTAMGGAANSATIAQWVAATSTWTGHSYPGGVASIGGLLDIGADGTVFLADSLKRVYQWDGSSWTLLGTADQTIDALAVGPDGYVYVVGQFTTIGGVSTRMAARYTRGSAAPAWEALANNTGPITAFAYNAIAFDAAGDLHLGTYSDAGTHWIYNGSGWRQGALLTAGYIGMISRGASNRMFLGGNFSKLNGVDLPDAAAVWLSTSAIPLDVDFPGSAVFADADERADGTIAVAFSTSGSAIASSVPNTITNTGTAKSYPTLTLTGPSSGTARLYQFDNLTTGKTIFLNLTINAGETAVFRFDPLNLRFWSDFQGDLAHTILPGSSEGDFFLAPGANTLTIYSAGSTVAATLAWRPLYASLDDVP